MFGNSLSVSQKFILDRKNKVKYYIRLNIHNYIVLKF